MPLVNSFGKGAESGTNMELHLASEGMRDSNVNSKIDMGIIVIVVLLVLTLIVDMV